MDCKNSQLDDGKSTNGKQSDFLQPTQDHLKRLKNKAASRTSKLTSKLQSCKKYPPLQANLRSKSNIHVQSVVTIKNNRVTSSSREDDVLFGNAEDIPSRSLSFCSALTDENNHYMNPESKENSTFNKCSNQSSFSYEFNSSLIKETYSYDYDMLDSQDEFFLNSSAYHLVKPTEFDWQSNHSSASIMNCTLQNQNVYEFDTQSVASSASKRYTTIKPVVLYKSKSFEKYSSNNCSVSENVFSPTTDTFDNADSECFFPTEENHFGVISSLLGKLETDILQIDTKRDTAQPEQINDVRNIEEAEQVTSKKSYARKKGSRQNKCKAIEKNVITKRHRNVGKVVSRKTRQSNKNHEKPIVNRAKENDALKLIKKFSVVITKGKSQQLKSLYEKLGCALNLNTQTQNEPDVKTVTKRKRTSKSKNNQSDYQIGSQQSVNSDLKSLYSQCMNVESSQEQNSKLNEILSSCQPYEFHENIIDLSQAFTNTVEFLSSIRMEQVVLTKTISLTDYVNSQTIKDKPQEVSVNITRNNEMFPKQDELYFSLRGLLKHDLLVYTGDTVSCSVNKCEILEKIQGIFRDLYEQQKESNNFFITYKNNKNWNNVIFHNERLLLKPLKEAKLTCVKFNRKNSKPKLQLMLYLLRKIYNLIMLNATCTKREIYYQIINYVRNQEKVNDTLNCISILLDVPPWKLGVFSTSRGLVYGNLSMDFTDFQLNCRVKGGILVPQNLSTLTKVESGALFILIVEKDSIFQKLIDEDNKSHFSEKYILITGKGYPDTNTRLFVITLWKLLRIPAFILVDSDPYGIEIMLCYKYGSLTSSHLSNELALPNLRWIGIWPSEIGVLNVAHQPLTDSDKKKIKFLLSRPYLKENSLIRRELEILLEKKHKAEIEGVIKSNHYLSNFYLYNKFKTSDFI